MSKTGWIVFIVIILGVMGGLIAWTRISNPSIDVSGVDVNSVIQPNDQNGSIGDHTLGKEGGNVILIEYGDFQCPSCSATSSNVRTLMDEYGDRATFVFRNFPLTTIHPNAMAAAAAAEAAGLQGKYWEMNHLLYENQDSWSGLDGSRRTEAFRAYAEQLSLNLTQFDNDIKSSNVSQKISFDQAIAKKKEVQATPTFYLNGTQLSVEAANGLVQGDLTAVKAEIDKLVTK